MAAAWTSAGSDFLTSFAADANNNGYATAPGVSVAISSKTLSVAIPNGSTFYLAWNYSVSSGSTTTNAQALAVDDISILGVTQGATNPSGTGCRVAVEPACGQFDAALGQRDTGRES